MGTVLALESDLVRSANEPINILLVDDRRENLVALDATLSSPDYNLVMALSGREALTQILDRDFAVILLDVQMPEMDGFETANLIRTREKSRHIPIIFITAVDIEQRYIYQGYEAGAVDYIVKPYNPQILRSKVSVFVELFRKSQAILRQEELIRENERKEHERRLIQLEIQSLRRYQALADAIPHMVWKSDLDGNLTYTNRIWIDYTGQRENQIVAWKDILHPMDLREFLESWERAKDPTPTDFESVVRIRRHGVGDGGYEWHLVRVVPELDEKGNLTAWLGTNTNIHARKLAQEELAEKAQELARSNGELEQFAYVASHDLQEPLRMVASYAQLLESRFSDKLGPSGKKFINYMVDGATRMQTLINDLLTFSRAGRGELPLERTDLNAVLQDTLNALSEPISASHAVIEAEKLPTVLANGLKVGQIFQNLLSNAIKFRRVDPPHVQIKARELENEWEFSVTDDGIGIEPKHFERIFVIFQRLHTRDRYPGTGIGLAIVRKIAERHLGRAWVESKPEIGSTFFFTISKSLSSPSAAAKSMGLRLVSSEGELKNA